jgi:hypothetical protein
MQEKPTDMQSSNKTESELIPVSTITNYLIPIGLFSTFVAYLRTSNSNIIMRVFYMAMAYLLNVFYLTYVAYKIVFPTTIHTPAAT